MDDNLAYSSPGYLWQFGLSFYRLWMTVWLIVLLDNDDNFALLLMANKFDYSTYILSIVALP